MSTEIAWTDETWNPVVGCTRVSAGCENCYAEKMAYRCERMAYARGDQKTFEFYTGLTIATSGGGRRWRGTVRCLPERLDQPLRWRKPRRIFVNSMSDLFHEAVPFEFVDRVFGVMALSPEHTFQVLTKRPARMLEYLSDPDRFEAVSLECVEFAAEVASRLPDPLPWPLPNVHIGVSVENQPTADERVVILLQTPAAVRFVSYEPALGPVDFDGLQDVHCGVCGEEILNSALTCGSRCGCTHEGPEPIDWDPLDWIIVGGESGPGARPCDVEWIRSTVRQCRAAGVACFVKQMGAFYVDAKNGVGGFSAKADETLVGNIRRLRDRKGADPSEWPEDLRVREFPLLGHGTR